MVGAGEAGENLRVVELKEETKKEKALVLTVANVCRKCYTVNRVFRIYMKLFCFFFINNSKVVHATAANI